VAKGTQTTPQKVAEIRRLRDEGLGVIEIASRVGVSKQSVTRYSAPRQDTDSGRWRILRSVAENGPLDIDELTGFNPDIDHHNTTHLLYSLSKQGCVTFRESKNNGSGIRLERITSTRRGFRMIGMSVRPQSQELGDLHAPSIRPGDMSDFRNLPSVAPGGPVEHIRASVQKQTQAKTTDDVDLYAGDASLEWKRYPVIQALFDRQYKLEEAARLLDEAGQSDLSMSALAASESFSPLELEAMRLYKLISHKESK
jgi:hypothetical protein